MLADRMCPRLSAEPYSGRHGRTTAWGAPDHGFTALCIVLMPSRFPHGQPARREAADGLMGAMGGDRLSVPGLHSPACAPSYAHSAGRAVSQAGPFNSVVALY